MGTVREIQNALGEEGLASLIEHFPGKRLYIPHAIPHNHYLRILPNEVVNRLIENFGGITLNVPSENRKARNKAIISDFHQGETHKSLAVRYELTERWISKIISSEAKQALISI